MINLTKEKLIILMTIFVFIFGISVVCAQETPGERIEEQKVLTIPAEKINPAKEIKEKPQIPQIKEEVKKEEVKKVEKVLKLSLPAKITFLAGSAKVKKAGEEKWILAKLNMDLKPLDEIRTGYDSQVVVTLNNEDKVTVKSNTHIVLALSEKEEKGSWSATIKLWLGEIRSHVEGLRERQGKYQVETLQAVAGVRGTDFIVCEGLDEMTNVVCLDGEVEVNDLVFNEKVILSKGQVTTVSLDQKPTPPRNLNEEELIKYGLVEKKAEEKEIKEEKAAEETEKALEEPKKKGKPAWRKNVSLTGEYGTEVIDGKLYQRISFQPEFCLGKVGVGLDGFILIDKDNKIRKEDWDEASDILEKVIYVRYGQPREPFYIRLGGISNVTLGHGMIMNKYSNLIKYPNVRKKGVELGINSRMLGLEGIVDDLNKTNIYGIRAYARPLVDRKTLFLLNKVTFGGTYCVDRDPKGDNKELVIKGLDVELPLKEGKILNVILYADVAEIKDHGKGSAIPGLLINLPMAMFKAEYRTMDQDFIPGYFNYLYDLERDTKKDTLQSSNKAKKGVYAEFSSNIFDFVSMSAYYEDYNETNPNLSAKVKLLKKIVPQITLAEASYFQDDVTRLKLKTEKTYIEWKVGYSLSGPVSLVYVYTQTYKKENGELKPVRNIALSTRVDF
ncbi:FecR family protein [bacterium]|nr:FecR family protein [bacterium]MBU1153806.1 FecR family protein [bacterium]